MQINEDIRQVDSYAAHMPSSACLEIKASLIMSWNHELKHTNFVVNIQNFLAWTFYVTMS